MGNCSCKVTVTLLRWAERADGGTRLYTDEYSTAGNSLIRSLPFLSGCGWTAPRQTVAGGQAVMSDTKKVTKKVLPFSSLSKPFLSFILRHMRSSMQVVRTGVISVCDIYAH